MGLTNVEEYWACGGDTVINIAEKFPLYFFLRCFCDVGEFRSQKADKHLLPSSDHDPEGRGFESSAARKAP